MPQLFQIANYQESKRFSCLAAGVMTIGEVIKIQTGAIVGARYATQVTTAADVQKQGLWGVVMKISADPFQVSTSTAPVSLGIRTISIATGDAVVQIAASVDTILEYDVSLLHSSLDPANSGATPAVGASLGIATSGGFARFSAAASTSLTGVGTSINVARVFQTFGTRIQIILNESGV